MADQLTEEQIADNAFHFSARQEIDYINEKFKLNLPDEEQYETLGGLIVYNTEEIPQKGDTVYIDDYIFTILEVSNTKIDLVKLEIIPKD